MLQTIKTMDRAELGGWVFRAGNTGLLVLGGFSNSWSAMAAGLI